MKARITRKGQRVLDQLRQAERALVLVKLEDRGAMTDAQRDDWLARYDAASRALDRAKEPLR